MTYPNLKPYRQGHLDGLCGVYSIVNTIHALHGPLSDTTATELFIHVIQQLERQAGSALQRLEDGTTIPELSKGLRSVVADYPIRWARPFHKRREISLNHFWQYCQTFIRQRQGVCILNIAKGEIYDHWTLVYRITDKTLFLLDSDGMQRIARRHCTMDVEEHNRVFINPTASFFIWREVNNKESHHG